VKEVPPLLPCPVCGLGVEAGEGPNGLAWHDCGAEEAEASGLPAHTRSVWGVILNKARDPAATADDLVRESLRSVLAGAALTGEGLNPQSVGALLSGHAQVKQAGGTTTLDELLAFHEDDEDEEMVG
jgi:hypothetical protein